MRPGGERVFNNRRDQRHAVDPKLHPHRRFRVRLSALLPGREPDLRIEVRVRVAQDGRIIWIVDAHRGDGRRFIVRADEIFSAVVELEREVVTVTFYLESIRAVR